MSGAAPFSRIMLKALDLLKVCTFRPPCWAGLGRLSLGTHFTVTSFLYKKYAGNDRHSVLFFTEFELFLLFIKVKLLAFAILEDLVTFMIGSELAKS